VSSGWDWATGSGGTVAVANVKPTQGNTASGKIEFKQSGSMVHVRVDLTGLAPGSEHGFHVHERGDCSAPDAMSAGGHFNPEGLAHGTFDHPPHHAGDLPNLKADDKGEVHTSFDVNYLSVGSGGSDVAGRSVILHRDPDDFKSQPAGNSGPRIACGIIVEQS
jgi:superoxide dismutase, Cu-Zn family